MLFYSANYIKGSSNFVIQNTHCKKSSSEYLPYIKILKNLLQRGNPTSFSTFLSGNFSDVDINTELKLIEQSIPKWSTTIKGDKENNYFPAKDFFYEVIPKYLSSYAYIQQLIIPEARITDIIDTDIQFLNSQVDFYLPIAKLVIEIDGEQHKERSHIISDNQRDELFNNFGIEVIRISTKDIKYKNKYFLDKIKIIENRLELYKDELSKYELAYHSNEISTEMNATAVMRWQILLLTLLENGKLSLTDKVWRFEVIDLENTQQLELSINDMFLWLRNLCALGKIPYQQPKITINYVTEFSIEDNLKLNFSLRKRWTDENLLEKEVIFVRSDYFPDKDYFQMSITDPITYKILQEGESSDIPVLKFFLKNIFGFDDFSDGQLPIIINVLEGKDTVGLLPTGGGKSLCYQLTAMLQPCVSFVVAPIKSLMYDQVDNLYRRNFIRTNLICGDQNGEEKECIQKEFARGKYWFILISPERFQIREFRQYLQMVNEDLSIALAVIDEVHCLSEWGHDFRTSYLHLTRTIRKYCPSSRFLGLTATASKFVLNDIMKELEVSKDNVKTLLKYTRPELRFNVLKVDDEDGYQKRSALFQLLNSFKEKRNIFDLNGDNTSSGLIFTTNVNGKKGCFELSQELTSRYKVPVKYYSGEKPKKSIIPEEEFHQYKVDVQNEFKENKIPLLVATKAFGMGIDKSNIRYTIHYGIPGSLESLYQEAGRAGRDKQQATSYILFSKERFLKDDEDKLFALETKIEDIKEIVKSYGFDGRDLLSNFFLWQSSLKGVDLEVELAYLIFKKYATPGSIKMIECKKIYNSSFQEIQKAIYRLSLLGIIDDWIITGWENRGSFEVTFTIYDEKTIMNSLLQYIGKYDSEFSITTSQSKYKSYNEILNDYKLNYVEKFLKILIQWTYDNIFYSRRTSLKNLVELCEKYPGNTVEFKQEIEKYFTFTESVFVLDSVAQNPLEYNRWFELLSDEKNGEVIKFEKLQEVKSSLTRYLETYRFNTGLNYLSGMIRLILDDFEQLDGFERLTSAFEQIKEMDPNECKEILINTLNLGRIINPTNREKLSEILCKQFPKNLIEIYDSLQDYNSLNQYLQKSLTTIKKLGDLIDG